MPRTRAKVPPLTPGMMFATPTNIPLIKRSTTPSRFALDWLMLALLARPHSVVERATGGTLVMGFRWVLFTRFGRLDATVIGRGGAAAEAM